VKQILSASPYLFNDEIIDGSRRLTKKFSLFVIENSIAPLQLLLSQLGLFLIAANS
jgi:hypothetical protein